MELFSEARALAHARALADDIGVRVVGTAGVEAAERYVAAAARDLASRARATRPDLDVDFLVHRPTGSFRLNFLNHDIANAYTNLTNVAVRVRARAAAGKNLETRNIGGASERALRHDARKPRGRGLRVVRRDFAGTASRADSPRFRAAASPDHFPAERRRGDLHAGGARVRGAPPLGGGGGRGDQRGGHRDVGTGCAVSRERRVARGAVHEARAAAGGDGDRSGPGALREPPGRHRLQRVSRPDARARQPARRRPGVHVGRVLVPHRPGRRLEDTRGIHPGVRGERDARHGGVRGEAREARD